MIPTNQFQILFDHDAIAQRFLILEAKRDNGNYYQSLVPDLALQVGRALSVAYARGACCYILYERENANLNLLKTELEQQASDVCLREISSVEMAQKQSYLLAQLLCNAMPALSVDGQMYHNLTGKLYHLDATWRKGRGEVPRSFWTIRIEFTWEGCIKLSVVTFSKAEKKKEEQGEAQYLFDGQSYTLRRLVQQDPDQNTPRFVMKNLDKSQKNTVSFLAFGSLDEFRRSKVGVLQNFLGNVARLLAPYLTLNMQYLQEEAHLGCRPARSQMEKIRRRLREAPAFVEDTVQDERSAELVHLLRLKLNEYSGISLCEGVPAAGDTLFRIVHNKEFYEDCPEQDPYRKAPVHCTVQHLTVEDFKLPGDECEKKKKEGAALRKVLQELAVKRDVLQKKITCYDWAAAGYTSPVNFVIIPEESKGKDKQPHYRRLRVYSDGILEYSQWEEELFWQDDEQEKIARAFQDDRGKVDPHVEGLVYQDPDNIHVIRKTDRYTLPEITLLQELLARTPNGEQLSVEPLAAVVQNMFSDAPEKERQALEIIYSDLLALAPQATRKQLSSCLGLRTVLGRRVNEEIFARTGVLLGSGMKQNKTKEQLFAGTLDIRLFTQGNAQYYYSGPCGQSLQQSLARACCIRKVTATGGQPHFAEYLPLMEVDFVRASAWTVLPFPFKYLREWKPQ